MGAGSEVVTEVAEGMLDGAEDLVVGEIDEFVGETLQEGVSLAPKSREDVKASRFTPFRGVMRGRRGFVQHGDHPGVRGTAA